MGMVSSVGGGYMYRSNDIVNQMIFFLTRVMPPANFIGSRQDASVIGAHRAQPSGGAD
jgi:hypothetical protein